MVVLPGLNSILPKKRRDSGDNLDDSGYQEEEKVTAKLHVIYYNLSITFLSPGFPPRLP